MKKKKKTKLDEKKRLCSLKYTNQIIDFYSIYYTITAKFHIVDEKNHGEQITIFVTMFGIELCKQQQTEIIFPIHFYCLWMLLLGNVCTDIVKIHLTTCMFWLCVALLICYNCFYSKWIVLCLRSVMLYVPRKSFATIYWFSLIFTIGCHWTIFLSSLT